MISRSFTVALVDDEGELIAQWDLSPAKDYDESTWLQSDCTMLSEDGELLGAQIADTINTLVEGSKS